MKYTLWYSCYIDLIRAQGVASTFVEMDRELVHLSYSAHEEATINSLYLRGVLAGLQKIPDGADVDIIGMSKYVDQVLKKLSQWMKEDGEIDLKSHSELLKQIWQEMVKKGKMTSQAFTSRRSDPMLWATSQVSGWQFRITQQITIERMKFPHGESWRFGNENFDRVKTSSFLELKWEKPFTDLQFEKLMIKRRERCAPILKLVT